MKQKIKKQPKIVSLSFEDTISLLTNHLKHNETLCRSDIERILKSAHYTHIEICIDQRIKQLPIIKMTPYPFLHRLAKEDKIKKISDRCWQSSLFNKIN